MAQKTTQKSEPAEAPQPRVPTFDTSAMTGFGVAWFEALSDMGSEVMSFVAERIREDVKTQHQMLHAKDLTELHHVQAEFIQTAIDQYTAETGKMVERSQGLYELLAKAGKTGE